MSFKDTTSRIDLATKKITSRMKGSVRLVPWPSFGKVNSVGFRTYEVLGTEKSPNQCNHLLLGYNHLVIVAYRPQANGLVDKELLNHLRSLVYEKRIRELWSYYLPLMQKIPNYTIDGSIGTQPTRAIFGDL